NIWPNYLSSCCKLNLTKYEGDDVSIQCKHHDEDQKSFCKAHEASMCVKDGVSLETIRDDRFSFSDESSTGVFTVNITDLREEDSGIYWCGTHITTKVNLNVSKDKGKTLYFICFLLVENVCKQTKHTHTHTYIYNIKNKSIQTQAEQTEKIKQTANYSTESTYTQVCLCLLCLYCFTC
uniref:Immunoglobulin domain-containing protein n=1 Tax=Sinocyclocheilus anshuiensis TaxID=1608454 RepID=A0A671NH70_9TELE